MKKLALIALIVIVSATALFSAKFDMNESGEKVVADHFEEDYFFVGDSLAFTGSADDIYFCGEKIVFTGETKSSLRALGKIITINGTVGNNLEALGQRIEITNSINGTVLIGGEKVILSEDSVINGAFVCGGGTVKIDGVINGDVYVGAGTLIINGEINGDVRVGAEKIRLQENGRINGKLKYSTDKKLSELDLEKVSERVEFTQWDKSKHHESLEDGRKFFTVFKGILRLMKVFSILIIGLLLLLFPVFKKLEPVDFTNKQFWFMPLYGLITIIVYIVGVFILPLTPFLLLGALPAITITTVLGITLFGKYLFGAFKWKKRNRFLFFLFGMAFFFVLSLMQGIAGLSGLFFSALGWGFIIEKLLRKKNGNNGNGDDSNDIIISGESDVKQITAESGE